MTYSLRVKNYRLKKTEISQRRLWGDVSNQSPERRFRNLQISPLRDVSETLHETSQRHLKKDWFPKKSHIFPKNFIEIPQVVQKIWIFSPSIATFLSIFPIFWHSLVTQKLMTWAYNKWCQYLFSFRSSIVRNQLLDIADIALYTRHWVRNSPFSRQFGFDLQLHLRFFLSFVLLRY